MFICVTQTKYVQAPLIFSMKIQYVIWLCIETLLLLFCIAYIDMLLFDISSSYIFILSWRFFLHILYFVLEISSSYFYILSWRFLLHIFIFLSWRFLLHIFIFLSWRFLLHIFIFLGFFVMENLINIFVNALMFHCHGIRPYLHTKTTGAHHLY